MKKNPYVLNYIICWLGWGIPMGLLCSVIFGSLRKGLLLGILGGLFFAVIMMLFTIILASRKDRLPMLLNHTKIIAKAGERKAVVTFLF